MLHQQKQEYSIIPSTVSFGHGLTQPGLWPEPKKSSHEDTKTPRKAKAVLIELVISSLLLFVLSCLSGKL
jgi:hypothetical protein